MSSVSDLTGIRGAHRRGPGHLPIGKEGPDFKIQRYADIIARLDFCTGCFEFRTKHISSYPCIILPKLNMLVIGSILINDNNFCLPIGGKSIKILLCLHKKV